MKSKKIIVAALVAVAAIVLAGCSPRSSMATLSTDSDSETAEVFSLAKVLNLGTNYLTSLDYDNAILQYIDIIQHDPTNKEAYAGLYAAYAAQGKADEANRRRKCLMTRRTFFQDFWMMQSWSLKAVAETFPSKCFRNTFGMT